MVTTVMTSADSLGSRRGPATSLASAIRAALPPPSSAASSWARLKSQCTSASHVKPMPPCAWIAEPVTSVPAPPAATRASPAASARRSGAASAAQAAK